MREKLLVDRQTDKEKARECDRSRERERRAGKKGGKHTHAPLNKQEMDI